jgi:hypothetical protein
MNTTLPEIKFPPHTTVTPMHEEVLVTDAHGNAEIIGPNNFGGYSRSVHGLQFGNYPTLADALRSAAREGYAQNAQR